MVKGLQRKGLLYLMPSLLVVVGVLTSISDLGEKSSSHLRTVRHASPSLRPLPPSPCPGSLVEMDVLAGVEGNLEVRDALGRVIVVNPSYTVEVFASHNIPTYLLSPTYFTCHPYLYPT